MRNSDKEDIQKENNPKYMKLPSSIGCIPDSYPHQKQFDFDELSLDSCFDSGNMANAIKFDNNHYHIWISPDCALTPKETNYRTWFHFRVKNVKKFATYTFTIKNMNFQTKLYNEGLMPVYKAVPSTPKWSKIRPQTLGILKYDNGIEMSFKHTFDLDDSETYFAFTFPWSYTEDQELLDKYEAAYSNDEDIYFKRELLIYSREERRVELLTISSHSGKLDSREKLLPGLFPDSTEESRPNMFENKKYVIISARVHPGEVPASHVLKGLLRFLFDKNDVRATAVRDNFVFVIIPILNPDGVYRGHYRADTHGQNLNRYYINPSQTEHPTIYAAKQIVLDLNSSQRLYLYCDLHAHASKKGSFIFGNNLEFRQQLDSRLFPKLLSLNSEYFEYTSCCFSDKNLASKEKGEGKDKDGAGRVALYKATGLVNCYTLECNYNSGKIRNVLTQPSKKKVSNSEEEEKVPDPSLIEKMTAETIMSSETYNVEGFEQIGEALGVSVLDMIEKNPLSRLHSSQFENLTNLRANMALSLMKEPPFRFDMYLRKLAKDITKNFDIFSLYLEKNIKKEPVEEKKEIKKKPDSAPLSKINKTVLPQIKVKSIKTIKETPEVKVMNMQFHIPVCPKIPPTNKPAIKGKLRLRPIAKNLHQQ